VLIPYDRPRGTIHDLRHIEGLESEPCHLICLSERSLYILQNLVAMDALFEARYATSLQEGGYNAVDSESGSDYQLFLSVTNQLQLEVIDMACDIQAGLESIGNGLQAIAQSMGGGGGGGGCPSIGSPVFNCIVNLDDQDLIGPPDQDIGDPEVDPPPEGFETWAEYYDYKCRAAHFIWSLERKHMVALRNFEGLTVVASIVSPVIAGLIGVLPAAMTPAGFVVFVTSIVAIGVLAGVSWFYMDEMIDYWDENKSDIVCAMYYSGTSPQAVSALSNALEDAIQAIVSWGALAPVAGQISGFLSTAFGQLAGNGIVEPLFKTVVAASEFEADCGDCEGEGFLVMTSNVYPYNVVIKGEYEDSYDNNADWGFKTRNSGTEFQITFEVEENVPHWHVICEVANPEQVPPVTRNPNMDLRRWTGSAWGSVKYIDLGTCNTGTWTTKEFDWSGYTLQPGNLYMLVGDLEDSNQFLWYRKVRLYAVT